jgi:Tol biopolymer transport system component
LIDQNGQERILSSTHNQSDEEVNCRDPIWSPDGSRIAFLREGWKISQQLAVVQRDGSREATIDNVYLGPRLDYRIGTPNYTFSPDGDYLAYIGGLSESRSQLTVVNLITGEEQILDEVMRDETLWLNQIHFVVAWLPN